MFKSRKSVKQVDVATEKDTRKEEFLEKWKEYESLNRDISTSIYRKEHPNEFPEYIDEEYKRINLKCLQCKHCVKARSYGYSYAAFNIVCAKGSNKIASLLHDGTYYDFYEELDNCKYFEEKSE